MSQTGRMHEWAVAGAILELDDQLLLVSNRRRDGSLDWSTPGGVVDPGETVLGALTREVEEETGLSVTSWGSQLYTIEVEFADLGNRLEVSVFAAESWEGSIRIDDPDGIVEDVRFCAEGECRLLLADTFLWVREPLVEWMDNRKPVMRQYTYRADGRSLSSLTAERL